MDTAILKRELEKELEQKRLEYVQFSIDESEAAIKHVESIRDEIRMIKAILLKLGDANGLQ